MNAHKYITMCKGSGGIKQCVLCQNVVRPQSNVLPDPTGYLVSSECVDFSKFVLHTAQSIRGVQKRLKKAYEEDDKGNFERLEVLYGFGYDSSGLLQDLDLPLELPQHLAWDWMHCYLVDGTFIREATACLEKLNSHNLGFARMKEYLGHFQWPGGYNSGKGCCSETKLLG
eukprot:1489550-Pyramimonas_sp.AAC.1